MDFITSKYATSRYANLLDLRLDLCKVQLFGESHNIFVAFSEKLN